MTSLRLNAALVPRTTSMQDPLSIRFLDLPPLQSKPLVRSDSLLLNVKARTGAWARYLAVEGTRGTVRMISIVAS